MTANRKRKKKYMPPNKNIIKDITDNKNRQGINFKIITKYSLQ